MVRGAVSVTDNGVHMRRLMMSVAVAAMVWAPDHAVADNHNMMRERHVLCAAALTVWGNSRSDDAEFERFEKMSSAHLVMLDGGLGVDRSTALRPALLSDIEADYRREVFAFNAANQWFAELVVKGILPDCSKEAVEIIDFSNPGGG